LVAAVSAGLAEAVVEAVVSTAEVAAVLVAAVLPEIGDNQSRGV
jgi:hypothetical protein